MANVRYRGRRYRLLKPSSLLATTSPATICGLEVSWTSSDCSKGCAGSQGPSSPRFQYSPRRRNRSVAAIHECDREASRSARHPRRHPRQEYRRTDRRRRPARRRAQQDGRGFRDAIAARPEQPEQRLQGAGRPLRLPSLTYANSAPRSSSRKLTLRALRRRQASSPKFPSCIKRSARQ